MATALPGKELAEALEAEGRTRTLREDHCKGLHVDQKVLAGGQPVAIGR